MPKYKVKEFANSYGIKESTVKSYVHRKQLQKDANGEIDTDTDKNKLFILEMQLKNDSLGLANAPEKKSKEKPTGLTASQQVYTQLDLRTKIATAEAKENESELKRIQIDKIAGKLLPVELVEKIFTINIQGVFKTFEGELENIASIYVEVLGGSRTELAEIIGKQREVLAKAIQKAKDDAEHEIEIAVDDYKQVRSRGERK